MHRSYFANFRLMSCVGTMACLLTPAADAQSVTLKPKFEPGRTVYVERDTAIKQNRTGGPGGEMKFTIKQTFGVLQTVESGSSDKGAKVKLTFDRVAIDSDAPMVGGKFDSDNRNDDESAELGAIYEPMVGSSVMAEIDKDNKTTVTGMTDIVAKMEKSAGGNEMFNQARNALTDDQVKWAWLDSRLMLFPNKEVKVGDTWKASGAQQNANLGALKTELDCKLESVAKQDGRDVAIVSYTGKITQKGQPKPTTQGAIIHVSAGSTSGKATLDVKRGELISQDNSTKLALKVEFGTGEQKMEISIDSDAQDKLTTRTEAERAKIKTEHAKPAPKKEAKPDKG